MLQDQQSGTTRQSADPSKLRLVIAKMIKLLQQSIAMRCIFALQVSLILNCSYLFWKVLVIKIPSLQGFVQVEFLKQEVFLGIAVGLLYIALTILIWMFRNYQKLQGFIEFFCLQVIAITMAYQGYTFGSVSVVTGIMLVCFAVIGLVMFSRLALYSAVLTGICILAGTAYAYIDGFLPYAPKFTHADMSESVDVAFFIMVNNFLFSAPILFGTLFAIDFLRHEIKEREKALFLLARLDPLTKVYNRHVIYEYMKNSAALNHPVDYTQKDSIILLDMDFFKKINDQYGHKVGDQVLIHAADILRKNIRSSDILARYGGEEFIIVLPDTEVHIAYTIAERCRQAIESSPLLVQQDLMRYTASFGVTTSQQRQHLDRQIDIADQALYQAKKQGRNCTVVFGLEHADEVLKCK